MNLDTSYYCQFLLDFVYFLFFCYLFNSTITWYPLSIPTLLLTDTHVALDHPHALSPN